MIELPTLGVNIRNPAGENASVPYYCCMILSHFARAAAGSAVTIPTVLVGDFGNANDALTGNLYGGVSYAYRIGTYEVTNAQYAEFLNAKAASDPLSLYSTEWAAMPAAGITRSGVSGSYTYAVKIDMGNKPVNYVSWYDTIRFANWLDNGQGIGDTETGAYTLLGGTPRRATARAYAELRCHLVPAQRERVVQGGLPSAVRAGRRQRRLLAVSTSSNSAYCRHGGRPMGPTRGDISNPGHQCGQLQLGRRSGIATER